jgi:hypothetical protein
MPFDVEREGLAGLQSAPMPTLSAARGKDVFVFPLPGRKSYRTSASAVTALDSFRVSIAEDTFPVVRRGCALLGRFCAEILE